MGRGGKEHTSLSASVSTARSTMPAKPTSTAMTSPRLMGSLSATAPMVMRRGEQVTKRRACGMLVCARPHTQVPKCSARQAPEAMSSHHSWPVLRRVSGDAWRHW